MNDADGLGRNAADPVARSDVAGHHAARPYNCAIADDGTRQHRRSSSDQDARSHANPSAQHRAGRDMRGVRDNAVVLDNRARIQHDIDTECGSRVHHDTRHALQTLTVSGAGTDDGGRVDEVHELKSASLPCREELRPPHVVVFTRKAQHGMMNPAGAKSLGTIVVA
jgi:hypothetical protein